MSDFESGEAKPSGFRQLLPVWIMIGTILSVVIAGYVVFPRTDDARAALLQSIGTKNQGSLLNPVADLSALTMTNAKGDVVSWRSDRPIWTVLVVASGSCGSYCTELLTSSRVVHARLDKNAHRVERYLLSANSTQDQIAQLAEEFPKLVILSENPEMQKILSSNNSAELLRETDVDSLIYLVDPRGVAMMVYAPEQESTAVLEDLKHLLKTLP